MDEMTSDSSSSPRTFKSLPSGVIRLWRHIGSRRQRQFVLLIWLMLAGSLAELVSIGVIFPFLVALTAPEKILASEYLSPILTFLTVDSQAELVLGLTVALIAIALASNVIRFTLTYASIRFGYAVGTDFSVRIFRDTLYQPYAHHARHNSSALISGIMVKTNSVVHNVLMPMLVMVNAILVLIAVAVFLLAAYPQVAASVFAVTIATYVVIGKLTKRPLRMNSERIALEATQGVKILQEGVGGIRDVVLEGTQEAHAKLLSVSDSAMRRAQAQNAALSSVPRYAMEFVGISALAVGAYVLARTQDNFAAIVPTLGILAMGAQRTLPYLQQALTAWLAMSGSVVALADTLELLEQPVRGASPANAQQLRFERCIELRQVGFRYTPDTAPVLRGIDLVVEKGNRVGIVGATGSGKSTLLDILMGLLEPTDGSLSIDGHVVNDANARSWQEHIAHVPQAIFLADASVEENIAIGVPRDCIDRRLLEDAARQAQIHDVILALPEGYATTVGERGVRLSGGQRQRIGIARALYKRADVILFDEATSALDGKTETAVMEAIESLGPRLTVFIIAHRLETLRNCDYVLELKDGLIINKGPLLTT